MAFTDPIAYKSVKLYRPETKSFLTIEFKTPKTQTQIEKMLESEWGRLPGFEFSSFEERVK